VVVLNLRKNGIESEREREKERCAIAAAAADVLVRRGAGSDLEERGELGSASSSTSFWLAAEAWRRRRLQHGDHLWHRIPGTRL